MSPRDVLEPADDLIYTSGIYEAVQLLAMERLG